MNSELIWALLVKGSLIVLLAGLAALALRKSSGARRHLIWLSAMAALLILPLAATRLPNWRVTQDQTQIVAPLIPPAAFQSWPPKAQKLAEDIPAAAQQTTPLQPQPAPKTDPTQPNQNQPKDLLLIAWFVGFSAVIAWTLIGLVRAAWLVRTSFPPAWATSQSPEQIAWATPTPYQTSRLMAASANAKILICPKLKVPATAGLFHPVIFLPPESSTWSNVRLQMVVAHESAHIKRCDWLWQTLAQLACAIHFFNPLAWLAARQLRQESELACDDYVIGQGIEPASYAQELLDIARNAQFQGVGAVGMARTKTVEHRLRAIMDRKRNRKWVSANSLLTALAAGLLIVLPIAMLRAGPGPAPKIPGQEPKRPRWVPSLPQIPLLASKQIAPNTYLAQNGIAGLPNGFRVRLVAVGREQGDMWGLDGKPFPDVEKWRIGSPYWAGNVFEGWNHGGLPQTFSRCFVVEVESDRPVDAGFTCYVARSEPNARQDSGTDDKIPEFPLAPLDPAYSIIRLNQVPKKEFASYRFAVSGTDWKTVIQIPNPATAQRRVKSEWIDLSANGEVGLIDARGNYHYTPLAPDGLLSKNAARRILLYDKERNLVTPHSAGSFTPTGDFTLQLTPEEIRRVDKIALQTSPYVWAEFQNVPLRPNFEAEQLARVSPHISGTAAGIAPGFAKTLPNGVQVSIQAVTKAAVDGKNWTFAGQPSWRADGEILAKPPKLLDWPRPLITWGKSPLIDFQIGYKGADYETSTLVEPIGAVDPTFWLNGDFPGSRPSLDSLTTAFVNGTKTAAVRVGVANGPWTTVAARTVNIPEQPALPKPQGARSDDVTWTGIKMSLGQIPTFQAESDKKPANLISKPLQGVARRFVAVLKNGKLRPLDACANGLHAQEFFAIPARHNESTEPYNRLIAADIKEIRLQSRPYQWTTFPNIRLTPK